MRAEGAEADDVGDRIGVPAFGEHGDGNDAADVGAERVGLADGVDDFAQQVGIVELFGCALSVTRA